jgi:hypothetical protein
MRSGEKAVIEGRRVYYNRQQAVKASKVMFVVDGRGFNEMRGRRIMTLGRIERRPNDG